MKKYEGILLCTDVDHTLVNSDGSLSEENAEAINYFMANGGMFTLCSGRPPLYLTKFHNMFVPNVPVICHNGATLYDYTSSQYVRTVWLNENLALKPLLTVAGAYREYINYMCFYSQDFQFMYSKDNDKISVDDFIEKFPSMKKNKYLVSFSNERLAHNIQMELSAAPEYKGYFEFSRSWSFGVEVLPLDGNKASGVLFLKNHLGNVTKTICVGDFENDISMLKIADIGYAVSNACESAKAVAARITVSNDESAIAKIISEI